MLGMSLHPKTSWASIPHLVTAADWADPSSYRVSPERLFPNVRGPGLECAPSLPSPLSQNRRLCLSRAGLLSGLGRRDMYIWRAGPSGAFHALFHDMQAGEFSAQAVTHGWSPDGITSVDKPKNPQSSLRPGPSYVH